jgi:hypothetical protein
MKPFVGEEYVIVNGELKAMEEMGESKEIA